MKFSGKRSVRALQDKCMIASMTCCTASADLPVTAGGVPLYRANKVLPHSPVRGMVKTHWIEASPEACWRLSCRVLLFVAPNDTNDFSLPSAHFHAHQRTMQGIFGLNFQFAIKCCMPTASSREPSPCCR